MPLAQIIQPVLWSFAVDCLNITPEPDFLVLADEYDDYHHEINIDDFT